MSIPDGQNTFAAMHQMRNLMVEVSKLLLETDAIMGEAGWGPRAASTALSGGSTSISSPRNWIPYRVFRFYRHEERRTVIPCVSVIFDDADQKVTEPLVSGLVMEFETADQLPEGNSLYQNAT